MTTIYTCKEGVATIANDEAEAKKDLKENRNVTNPRGLVRSEEPGVEEFEAAFGKPVQHKSTETGNPHLLETYGVELEMIKATDPKKVWTITEGDDGLLRVTAGRHKVNAINYLTTTIPWETGEETFLWG
jgi:hypothetical protein